MYGSNHTDSIIAEDQDAVAIFFKNVDSSSVMHNLPTCWADGLNMVSVQKLEYQLTKFMLEVQLVLKG